MSIERPPHSRIALPSKSLTKTPVPGDDFEFKYVNSANTNIAERFARWLAEQKPDDGDAIQRSAIEEHRSMRIAGER